MKRIALFVLIMIMFAAAGCANDIAGLIVDEEAVLDTGTVAPYDIDIQLHNLQQKARDLIEQKNKLLAGIKIVDEKLLRLEGAFEILKDMKATVGDIVKPEPLEGGAE